MKKNLTLLCFFSMLCTTNCFSQGEVFAAKRVVNANTVAGRFRNPFAMVMGPDDSLWVTERRGYVMRVNTSNGGKTQLLNISPQVRFTTTGSGSGLGIKQDGMFGIALHPDLNKGMGHDYVYLAYCYDSSTYRRVKIVRYNYNRSVPGLTGETTLLQGIHGSDDHNGGRLVIGNFGTTAVPDYKLIYSVGDKGSNQFGNACDSIESQYLPTAPQIAAGDLHRYNGKILRLNLDGTIPTDNPVLNGVKSHIWSYGHRNPQGLTFQKDALGALVPNGKLYESEQGPATNDEINIITSGNNYGWPRVAGKKDNNWYRYYQWSNSGSCVSYSSECSTNQTTLGLLESSFSNAAYKDPIFDLYPGTPTGGSGCNWLTNPTIAPSSVIYYPYSFKIPNWKNCLLITTLKSSTVYRLKLNAAGDNSLSVIDSVIPYFKDNAALNRLRDIVLGTDGITLYVLTDSVGGTSGPSAGTDGGVTDRGCILEYKYTGATLALGDDPVTPQNVRLFIKMYPNPTTKIFFIETKRNISKPVYYWLYDMMGNMVLAGSSTKDKFEVNIEKLSKGIYTLKLYNSHDIIMVTEKIVIQ